MDESLSPARLFGRPRPTLEVHVPGSPTPVFLNMIRCLTLSLRHFGGAYRDAPVVFTVGAEDEDHELTRRNPWMEEIGIEVRWVPAPAFRERFFFATGNQRFQYQYRADVVLMLDADTLISGPLDELVDDVARNGCLAGVIAHARPFTVDPSLNWDTVFKHCGIACPELEYEYTGWGAIDSHPQHRYCPAYFNAGVLCAPAEVFSAVGSFMESLARQMVAAGGVVFFQNQIAVTLATAKLGIATRALPMRYNYPNDPLLEALHASEFPHARILHMLRAHQGVDKKKLFASRESLAAFLARTDLHMTNKRAQDVIGAIWPALCRPDERPEAG